MSCICFKRRGRRRSDVIDELEEDEFDENDDTNEAEISENLKGAVGGSQGCWESDPPPIQDMWANAEDAQYLEKVSCKANIRVIEVKPQNGSFELRAHFHWLFRTPSSGDRTEPRIRVPGIRCPGLIVKVEESRVWRDTEGDTEVTMRWLGTSVFRISGFKIFDLHDFPFDRQVIKLGPLDLVWRRDQDTNNFEESMRVVRLKITTQSMVQAWKACQCLIEPKNIITPEGDSFIVDNSQLKSGPRGLQYCMSKRLEDFDKSGERAPWGSIVSGTDAGDNWLQLEDGRFLPMKVDGVPVLTQGNFQELFCFAQDTGISTQGLSRDNPEHVANIEAAIAERFKPPRYTIETDPETGVRGVRGNAKRDWPTYCTQFVVRVRLQRRHEYYISEVFFVSCVILFNSLWALGMSPSVDHAPDRLALFAGGMLTLITFKYGVAAHLPHVAYQTWLDIFLSMQIYTLIAVSVLAVILLKFVAPHEFTDPELVNGTCTAAQLPVMVHPGEDGGHVEIDGTCTPDAYIAYKMRSSHIETVDHIEDSVMIVLMLFWAGFFLYAMFCKKHKTWSQLQSAVDENDKSWKITRSFRF